MYRADWRLCASQVGRSGFGCGGLSQGEGLGDSDLPRKDVYASSQDGVGPKKGDKGGFALWEDGLSAWGPSAMANIPRDSLSAEAALFDRRGLPVSRLLLGDAVAA